MRQYFIDTFRFNDWANRRTLEAMQKMPGDKESVNLFSHLIRAQDKWMRNSPLGDQSPYRGLSEVRDKVFARLAAGLPGLTIKADEIFAAGDEKVVMLGYYDGVFKATGKQIHAQVAHVWTLSGGKVVKFQQYTDTYQLAKSAK